MELDEAKMKFIMSWGNLANNWGVNRTMGQIHGLLLASCRPLSAEEIMDALKVSRGNVNMNLRSLMDWQIVHKHCEAGERKEFFVAEKDMWKVLIRIIHMRKKKELDPMVELLEELSFVQPHCNDSKEFSKVIKDISHFSKKADSAIDNLIHAESSILMNTFIKMIR